MPKKTDPPFPLLTYVDELVEDLRGNVPRAMKEYDAGAIHRARVATRRLKAAVDLLRPVLSNEHRKPFADVTRKLRRRLGPMRDLDVMIGHLEELRGLKRHADAVAWLEGRLQAQRQRVRDEAAKKGSHHRVLSRLGTWWGLREEVLEAREAADTLLAESLHAQLDAFAEQADRMAREAQLPSDQKPADQQDPHAVRIAGKGFRYTLEMAGVQGHKLPGAVMGSFKRMQESLGLWHDYVVLTERAMQMSLEALLPHHDATLQCKVLDLARALVRRSSQHLDAFTKLWSEKGCDVAAAIRATFPLTRSVSEPKTDLNPPDSGETPAPEAPPTDVPSADPA